MGALDGYFRQFEELERLTKPLREMEVAVKAAFDLTPLRETLRQFDFDAQYKTAVTKMGLDLASIHNTNTFGGPTWVRTKTRSSSP